jgi:stage III sporulation protein AF
LLEWLSDWLKQILAVVLLASVVDLLMPGKSFHRYMRFVLGLLILLAMLGPVLKLLKDDPEVLLENGMRGWEAASRKAAPEMPGLDEIERRAEQLRKSRDEQAAAMTAQGLAAAIESALSRHPGMPEAEVKVAMGGLSAADGPWVETVTVQFVSDGSVSVQDDGQRRSGQEDGAVAVIAPVERVDTTIALDLTDAEEGSGQAAEDRARNVQREAPAEAAAAVRALVYQGWGVEPERIIVLAPAESS